MSPLFNLAITSLKQGSTFMKSSVSFFVLISSLILFTDSAFAMPGYTSKTSGQISISPDHNLIVATTITNWDPKSSDTLIVKWAAPQGSFCRSSIFKLTPGNNTSHDVSWSYRTVIHTTADGKTIVCSGKWTASLVNEATGHSLASAGYIVSGS